MFDKICPDRKARLCAICAETAPSWTMSNGMPPHYPSMELSLIATASCPGWLKAWYSVILSFTKCFNETGHGPLLWVIGPCTDVYAPMAPWPPSRSASTAPVLSLWRHLALLQQWPLHYRGYHPHICAGKTVVEGFHGKCGVCLPATQGQGYVMASGGGWVSGWGMVGSVIWQKGSHFHNIYNKKILGLSASTH